MVSRMAKQTIMSWLDRKQRSISAKLQPRYAGPYLITGQRSPVVFILQIDGRDKYVHAVNMKPFSGKQTYTTPYSQIGFSEAEIEKEEVAEQPLLMSPNPEINEAARTGYLQKNPSAQRDMAERRNKHIIRSQRERSIQQKRENSELTDDWILDQYNDVQDDDEVIEYRKWLKEKERRRKFLLKAQSEAFENMTEEEQRFQSEMIDEHGLTAEDMIDMELASQEENWRESLADSLRTDNEYYEEGTYSDEEGPDMNRAIARRS